MSIYEDQIKEMMYESQKLLEKYIRELDDCTQGSLSCCKTHGKDTFYHTFHEDGKYVRTVVGKDAVMIRSLARKEYLTQAIKTLSNNIDALTKSANKLQPMDIKILKEKMPRAYRALPDEYFFDGWFSRPGIYTKDSYLEGIRRHEDWAKEPFEQSDFNLEGRRFPTSAGFDVRSKSEQSIVEQLVNYGVPFRYEEVIWIGNRKYSSDFTFRTRQLERYYWEHAGMMDVPAYADRHKRKMNDFEKVGTVPWNNLIVTYDKEGVINVPLIKSIIENEILPRL